MNSEQFLREAITSGKAPEGFEKVYEDFKNYQRYALDTLKEFHRVCELHDIGYMLADGTLIGAIRNRGQIPWDYDIDVFVPLEQRDALIAALKQDLGKDYYFYCPEIDSKCRHFFMRVAPVGFRTEELHVDVFYFIGAPDDEEERKKIADRLDVLIESRYSKLVNPKEASYGNLKAYIKLSLDKLKVPKKSVESGYREFDSLKDRWPLIKANYVLRADSFNWDRRFNKGHFRCYYAEDFINTMLYETEVGTFRIPAGYDRFLTETYGDYMREPPIESCIREVTNSYSKLRCSKRK